VEPEETPVSRQQLDRHVCVAMGMHATTRTVESSVFYAVCAEGIY
jgi:hypothetical protein